MTGIYGARFWLAAILTTGTSVALPPVIGVASSSGSFSVNQVAVDGNANLFEGSEVRTDKAPSQIFLNGGTSVILGIASSADLYRDHLQLHSGVTRVDHMNGFRVEADNCRIEQDQPDAQGVVRLQGGVVQIAALSGALKLLDQQGVLLSRVSTGTAATCRAGALVGADSPPASSTPSGSAPTPNNNNTLRKYTAATIIGAAALGGLGYGLYEAFSSTTPTSP